MTTKVAADVSNYTGALTPARIQDLKDLGVSKVIVQIVDPPAGYPDSVWRQQIPAAYEAGFKVDTYVYLWNSMNYSDQATEARHKVAAAGYERLVGKLWLDTEDVSFDIPKETAAEMLTRTIKAAPMTTGVYTGKWYADAAFPRQYLLPVGTDLWVAEYDDKPRLGVWTPFWGVTSLAMKQYEGSRELAYGGQIDLNVYEDTPEEPVPQPELSTVQKVGALGRIAANAMAGAYASEVVQSWAPSERGSGWYDLRASVKMG